MSTNKKWYGIKDLEARYGPMTVGMFVRAFRMSDEISQADYAKKLKISKANLCDIEKGRKLVSPERAAKFAKILQVSEVVLIRLAIQDMLRSAKLNYEVSLEKAS